MELQPLLAEMPDASLRGTVNELVRLKAEKEEGYRHPREKVLDEFLAAGIASCDTVSATLPAKKASSESLDVLFREILNA